MTPKRQRIIEAVGARLESIRTTNGFETDAGLAVYYGPVVLGPDDAKTVIAIIPGDTGTSTASQSAGKKVITLPIEIQIAVRDFNPQPGVLETSWLNAEKVLGDVKRAIEAAELVDLLAVDVEAGEVVPLRRTEGQSFVGLSAQYQITYTENWGDPTR